MSMKLRIGRFYPDGDSRESRMLALGRLTVTVSSRKTGRHMTLRLRAKDADRGWEVTTFDAASHVFVDDFDGGRVATYYPRSGMLFYADDAGEAARWTVQAFLRWVAGTYDLDKVAEIQAADICGRCGQPLTDPESIERGYGPTCMGVVTSSRHAEMHAAA